MNSSEQLRKLEKIKLFGHSKAPNKKIMTDFTHFPRPGENDPYENSGEKPNKCNYSSSRTDMLRTHLKTHCGEKFNKCNQCNYASSRTDMLSRHLKTHNGERLNKCNQCDFESSQSDHLRTHLKTHSGEKPNKCNQCKFCFFLGRHVEETFENAQWRKVKQMQQV